MLSPENLSPVAFGMYTGMQEIHTIPEVKSYIEKRKASKRIGFDSYEIACLETAGKLRIQELEAEEKKARKRKVQQPPPEMEADAEQPEGTAESLEPLEESDEPRLGA